MSNSSNAWVNTITADSRVNAIVGRSLRPPLHDPSELIDMTARIRHRRTVTGLINEYRRAA